MLKILTFWLFAFLCIVRLGAAAEARCAEAVTPSSVLFVTDREPVDGTPLFGGERGISPDRSPIISYGVIAEPVSRKTLVTCDSPNDFLAAMRRQFDPKSQQALLYVHGYFTSFTAASEAALTLRNGLGFPGPIIVWSWPSKYTSRLTYLNDIGNADWSFSHFTDLLAQMQRQYSKIVVSFATHSLGARFAQGGIRFIRHSPCRECFGHAVLFAPDLDGHALFSELTGLELCPGKPHERPTSSAPVTLYASNRDLALRLSQQLSGHQRAGQAGNELILCPGVDTIDVSRFNGSDRGGHNYHLDEPVIHDAAAAFSGIPPTDPSRKLQIHHREGDQYYELHNP